MLQRFPDGATGKSFYQKRIPAGAPDWLQSTTVSTPNGTTSNALVVADIAHVVWAVNIGCLGLHLWPYLAADPDHADELRIDLDPTTGIGFDEVRAVALLCRDVLEELGLRGYPKTTGNNGLHVYLRLEPRWDSVQVRAAAVALARELERRFPISITANWWKEERGSRVFVDFNQNAPHKTVFGAWFARPRTGGQVSTPAHLGRGRDGRPQRPDHPHRARPGAPAAATPGPTSPPRPSRSSPCWQLAAARQGGRAARRAVATAVPQDARRAAPGGARAGPRRPEPWNPSTPSTASPSCLERSGADTYKVRAFRHAARAVADDRHRRRCARWPGPGRLQTHRRRREVDGAGHHRGPRRARCPTGLTQLEEAPDDDLELDAAGAQALLESLRGDCHSHSDWSDGGSPIREMAEAARDLGHDYLVLTDHSARLTVAHGLNAERLRAQLDVVAELNEELAPFRILTGIEVDILEDGSLDQELDLLAELDVVVASVHSKLRMEAPAMTERMLAAIESPHTDILGPLHRAPRSPDGAGPQSTFDADAVFAACARTGTAVEINSRPERQDPPQDLLRQAVAARLLLRHRHRRPRPGPARLARPGLRQGRRRRGAARADRQPRLDRRAAGLGRRAWRLTRSDAPRPSAGRPHAGQARP